MMKRRIRLLKSNRSTGGFTLLEMLVIILIIGVLFAIAAPGWDAFLHRQRLSTARDQVLQAIQQTQSEAKRTNSARILVFDNNNGTPRFASAPYIPQTPLPIASSNFNNWQTLGNSDIRSGSMQLKTSGSNNAIVFESNGTIAKQPTVPAEQFVNLPDNQKGFAITVARAGVSGSGTNRCVIISTLIGATRLEQGAACP